MCVRRGLSAEVKELLPSLRQGLSFVVCTMYASLAHLGVSGDSPVSVFHVAMEALDGRCVLLCSAFHGMIYFPL